MIGSNCCFCPSTIDSPISTMTSCRSNASDGSSVMSIFSPDLALFIQLSSVITASYHGYCRAHDNGHQLGHGDKSGRGFNIGQICGNEHHLLSVVSDQEQGGREIPGAPHAIFGVVPG